jgi:hypothetical protein
MRKKRASKLVLSLSFGYLIVLNSLVDFLYAYYIFVYQCKCVLSR